MARENFIEMRIGGLTLDPVTKTPIVILKDAENKLNLPIWIGLMEATAMATELEGIKMARPMTHDLLASVLTELGGAVDRVVVNDLANDMFFARLHVRVDERELEIDARPSDALALAVRSEAPIFVEDAVLERAGVTLDESTEGDAGDETRSRGPAVKPEEIEKMSAFKDFIEGLDLDDFDRR